MTPAAQRLSVLLQRAGITPRVPPGVDPEIRGATLDSRRVRPGDAFIAVPGQANDGERFVPQAIERGALAVLARSARPSQIPDEVAWVCVPEPRQVAGPVARECYGRPDETITVVGITGTNGKTSVAYLVEAIARAAGLRTGRLGTVGYAFGETTHRAERTTPEAPEVFRLLAEMREHEVTFVSMEVSSHALALHRVRGLHFTVAAFLNLSRDHLDFHRTEEAYFESKALLFDGLGPEQSAVLPIDDPHGRRLAARTRARLVRFGRSAEADVRLCDERCTLQGSRAVLRSAAGEIEVETPLVGRFNLDNVAAAAACALASGLPAQAIPAGVRSLRGVPGRMERVEGAHPFTVLIDYAHTDEALARLLEGVHELVDGRVILVFGCGGERDRGKRPRMGRVAVENADLVFVTSDNPRGEDPSAILREIGDGVASVPGGEERARFVVDRAEAVAGAIAAARPGDVVLLAGKGHETTQTIGELVLEQTDRELAERGLAARFGD